MKLTSDINTSSTIFLKVLHSRSTKIYFINVKTYVNEKRSHKIMTPFLNLRIVKPYMKKERSQMYFIIHKKIIQS